MVNGGMERGVAQGVGAGGGVAQFGDQGGKARQVVGFVNDNEFLVLQPG